MYYMVPQYHTSKEAWVPTDILACKNIHEMAVQAFDKLVIKEKKMIYIKE